MLLEQKLRQLEERLHHSFADQDLLVQALTHRSYPNEHARTVHNERLEFLGDAVLQLLISEILYSRRAAAQEGELSRTRSILVNTRTLSRIARQLELGELVRLGEGEKKTGGTAKVSILADAVEALIAASYLDGGMSAARTVVTTIFAEDLENALAGPPARDVKSELQELLQARRAAPPQYTVEATYGPEHERRFTVRVQAIGLSANGEGSSKKKAEQDAAAALLRLLTASELLA
jgi:ribonuclease-3